MLDWVRLRVFALSRSLLERSARHEFGQLSGRVIEAAIAVHRELGPGFLESIYENAMKTARRHRGIVYESQKEVTVVFEGEEAGVHRLDLLVENEIVVELKAIKALEDVHFAQVKSYLKARGLHVGLLMNFNAPTLLVKRVVLDYRPAESGAAEWKEDTAFVFRVFALSYFRDALVRNDAMLELRPIRS